MTLMDPVFGLCVLVAVFVLLFQQKHLHFSMKHANVHHIYLLCPPQTVSKSGHCRKSCSAYCIIALASFELFCIFWKYHSALNVLHCTSVLMFVVDFDMQISKKS